MTVEKIILIKMPDKKMEENKYLNLIYNSIIFNFFFRVFHHDKLRCLQ